MTRMPVDSCQVKSIGYDEDSQILQVEFVRGNAIYNYFDVPEEVFDHLQDVIATPTMSFGREFNVWVKTAGFRYEKVEELEEGENGVSIRRRVRRVVK